MLLMADKRRNLSCFRLSAQVAIRDNLTSELLLTCLQSIHCDTIIPCVKDVTSLILVLIVTSESDAASKNHNLVVAERGENGIDT